MQKWEGVEGQDIVGFIPVLGEHGWELIFTSAGGNAIRGRPTVYFQASRRKMI